jgi:hypothetical protein
MVMRLASNLAVIDAKERCLWCSFRTEPARSKANSFCAESDARVNPLELPRLWEAFFSFSFFSFFSSFSFSFFSSFSFFCYTWIGRDKSPAIEARQGYCVKIRYSGIARALTSFLDLRKCCHFNPGIACPLCPDEGILSGLANVNICKPKNLPEWAVNTRGPALGTFDSIFYRVLYLPIF